MHFKSVVILCALYFVTVTQSIGLNGHQIKDIGRLFLKHKNGTDIVSKEDIETIGRSIGMNNISDFVYEKGVADARKLQDLLVFAANNDKSTDNLKIASLSSYEVRYFVRLFSEYDQRGNFGGLLPYDQAKQVIDAFALENGATEYLESTKNTGININVSMLLYWFLNGKEEGNGLDQSQVQELIDLHEVDGNHINPGEITQFFINLSKVESDNEGRFAFESIRKTPLELQELLVVTAEYNKKAKTGTVHSTSAVRYVLWDFAEHDGNKDGLLNNFELEKLALRALSIKNADAIIEKYDKNGDNHLDIAEFFIALFTENMYLKWLSIVQSKKPN